MFEIIGSRCCQQSAFIHHKKLENKLFLNITDENENDFFHLNHYQINFLKEK